MKFVKRKLLYVLCIILLFTTPINLSAHSGRTDSRGGHHDYKNKSGLGSYHYHHGMEAHLHPGGICPYDVTEEDYESPKPPKPSIKVKEYPKSMVVGESSGIDFTVSNATDDKVYITSSDSEIIDIDSKGKLTALGLGKVKITIESSGVSESFNVEVKSVPVDKIKITSKIDRLQLGEGYKLKAKISPKNATNKKIIWASDNSDIAEVDKKGNITTKSPGFVKITATSKNGIEASTSLEVYEVVPESIECKASTKMFVGNSRPIEVKVLPENANNKNYTITCDNPEILQCEESYIKGLKAGNATLHVVTWNGIAHDINVQVDIVHAENVEIEDDTEYFLSNMIDKNNTICLSAKVNPANATYNAVSWSSSNEDIVKIVGDQFAICGTGKVTLTCTTHEEVANSIDVVIVDVKSVAPVSMIGIGGVAAGALYLIRKRKSSFK